MSDRGFNGTTVTFDGSAIAHIMDVQVPKKAPKVNVSGADDTEEEYEVGKTDREVTVKIVGYSTLSVGDKGALTVTWNDGNTDTFGNVVVTDVSVSGSKNGAITTDIKFAPTPA